MNATQEDRIVYFYPLHDDHGYIFETEVNANYFDTDSLATFITNVENNIPSTYNFDIAYPYHEGSDNFIEFKDNKIHMQVWDCGKRFRLVSHADIPYCISELKTLLAFIIVVKSKSY